MPEQVLIDHCSPTLAGLKTGSMFPIKVEPGQDIIDELRQLNRQLRDKGLCVVMLRRTDKNALVYVYRPDHLERDLGAPEARRILESRGYCCGSTGNCLVQLIRHMEKTFSKFRKCTALYRRELSRGKSLAQLAVRTRICGGRDYYNEKKGKKSYE